MHGNSNLERITRKERNARPPRGEQQDKRPEFMQRGKAWTRENNKREQSEFFNAYQ